MSALHQTPLLMLFCLISLFRPCFRCHWIETRRKLCRKNMYGTLCCHSLFLCVYEALEQKAAIIKITTKKPGCQVLCLPFQKHVYVSSCTKRSSIFPSRLFNKFFPIPTSNRYFPYQICSSPAWINMSYKHVHHLKGCLRCICDAAMSGAEREMQSKYDSGKFPPSKKFNKIFSARSKCIAMFLRPNNASWCCTRCHSFHLIIKVNKSRCNDSLASELKSMTSKIIEAVEIPISDYWREVVVDWKIVVSQWIRSW